MEAVLDSSTVLAWVLREETRALDYADAVLRAADEGAVFHAPFIFEAEIAAVLLRAVRRRALTIEIMNEALARLEDVDVRIHHNPYTARSIIAIAGRHHLQAYDALYFHLAQVLGLPIATLDGGLRTAAKAHGVKLFAA
jgi:predicted nucleic acid-binding protein